MLLSISKISKSLGGHQILDNASFSLERGEHTGLVGANGVGKTTLLKIIAGEIEADSGEVTVEADMEIGYLPQILSQVSTRTIAEVIRDAQGDLQALRNRLAQLEDIMGQKSGEDLSAVMEEYGEVTERFERLGGYQADHRLESVLSGLQLDYIPRERVISSLSGGEKARIAIAALLLRSPELLLLDEPTNHLDFKSLEWLEGYLTSNRGAILLVSHDREFLNRTVHSIVEIEEHTRNAVVYPGDYDAFVHLKRAGRTRWETTFESQQEEIKELKRMIKGRARQVGHGRPAPDRDKITHKFFGERVQRTVARNVSAAEEKLRQLESSLIPKPPEALQINPDFKPGRFHGKIPLTVSHLYKSYGDRPILTNVSFVLREDSRVVLTGPNGTGKSSLLRILVGIDQAYTGTIKMPSSVKVGYLDQEQETLDGSKTLFEAYSQNLTGDREELKAMLLRTGFFRYQEFQTPVNSLSVGQKRKLQIARLIANQGNLLLLDEPTNHVSFDVLEEFEDALIGFKGPVLAVSHDRRFTRRFAKEIWELKNGQLEELPRLHV